MYMFCIDIFRVPQNATTYSWPATIFCCLCVCVYNNVRFAINSAQICRSLAREICVFVLYIQIIYSKCSLIVRRESGVWLLRCDNICIYIIDCTSQQSNTAAIPYQKKQIK